MSIYGCVLQEKYLKSEPDILYNKDKFDSGEINLCFIIGHSGSGKSTFAKYLSEEDNVEYYSLDDVIINKPWFSMEDLKKYGDLIYSFFNGVGKKFYLTNDEMDNSIEFGNKPILYYEVKLITDFVKYSISYSKSHKNTKFIIEGIWIYEYIDPEMINNFAVYIKGTSFLSSTARAVKRDFNYGKNFKEKVEIGVKRIIRSGEFIFDERKLQQFRNYFK